MTDPSNTPDKPMTREEAITSLLDMWANADEQRGRDANRVMPRHRQPRHPGWLEARERLIISAARQSILKEMEGWDWEDLVYRFMLSSQVPASKTFRDLVLNKLKGEGV